jgi:secreted trypsin-like serine protease
MAAPIISSPSMWTQRMHEYPSGPYPSGTGRGTTVDSRVGDEAAPEPPRSRRLGGMRKTVTVAVASIAVLVSVALLAPTPATALVGATTSTESYPFIAAVDTKKSFPGAQFSFDCTAVLVAPQRILSAAHCFDLGSNQTIPTTQIRVRVGSNDRTSGGFLLGVTKVLEYPDFSTTGVGDLAMVKLAYAVPYAPVQLATNYPPLGTPVRLLGWGRTCSAGFGCGDFPTDLRELVRNTVSDGCTAPVLPQSEFCVDSNAGHATCYGDSGGPALERISGGWWEVGELSRAGDGNGGCADQYSIYTGVPYYHQWIQLAMFFG